MLRFWRRKKQPARQIIPPDEINGLELRFVRGPDGSQEIALVEPKTGEIKYRDLHVSREALDRVCRGLEAGAKEIERDGRVGDG